MYANFDRGDKYQTNMGNYGNIWEIDHDDDDDDEEEEDNDDEDVDEDEDDPKVTMCLTNRH